MTRTQESSWFAAALWFCCASALAQSPHDGPYLTLRQGYASLDAQRAASAYAELAAYAELDTLGPPRVLAGRSAIAAHFTAMLGTLSKRAPKPTVDLNFRLTSRLPRSDGSTDAGYYRLRISGAAGEAPELHYGRFATQSTDGKFIFDASADADLTDFESAAGDVLFDAEDEVLAPSFYDRMVGRYVDSAGCAITITRSQWRLFAFDECNQAFRGLNRSSGFRFFAGQTVISEKDETSFLFEPTPKVDAKEPDAVHALRVVTEARVARVLRKLPVPQSKEVVFESRAARLHGTLTLPYDGDPVRKHPGVVLVHGSGPQDRHGYASIIQLLADRFARAGYVTLAYDKRGVAMSTGDGASAGFDVLGADANAALAHLRKTPGVDPNRIGFAGSSQAGWVVADALRQGSKPAFAILIGAAGTALTVEEQNAFNTRTRMECARLPALDIDLALAQQKAFFGARRDPQQAPTLTELSRAAAARPALTDWVFPDRVTPQSGQEWYNVLDPDFDPLPIWASYRGRTYFLFGEHDDATPTALVTSRLSATPFKGPHRVDVVPGAQHLGLRAESPCAGDLTVARSFHPALIAAFDAAIRDAAATRDSRQVRAPKSRP